MRFPAPVFVGDTLYTETEVLAVAAPDDATGIVTFKHTGSTSDGTIVFEGERRVLLRRRP
jgi:acyl dehydratase